ncbi:MAG: class I SAM-dependent methyltransferase [Candidatus Paceibacterota bacterium]|jgi:ubiquinone/menaquinone biosynthesis C-methylase UbiE
MENIFKNIFNKKPNVEKRVKDDEQNKLAGQYRQNSIEHPHQPAGGRDLKTYESQLLFDKNELKGKRVLDLGAGPEVKIAKELKESEITSDVVSLSPDFAVEKHLKKAKESFPEGKFEFGLGQNMPFPDKSFDVVLASHIDEYLSREDFFKVIAEMARVLKDGGWAKIGPTVDIPGDWNAYESIRENQELFSSLTELHVDVTKELVSEMGLMSVKDGYGNRFETPFFNIVLKKKPNLNY